MGKASEAVEETQESESLSIPFTLIEVPKEFNCRTAYDEAELEKLALSIQKQGLITPLTVTKNGGDSYMLVSGFRRYLALKSLKWGSNDIPVVARSFESNAQIHLANLVENTARGEVHPADLAKRFHELESGTYMQVLTEHTEESPRKITRKEIAEQTGLSPGHIGNLIRAHVDLAPAAQKFWRKNNPPLSKVFKVATEKDEDKQIEKFDEWKTIHDEIEEKGPKKRKKKAAASKADSAESESAVPQTKSAVAAKLAEILEKEEGLKGEDLLIAKTKSKTLRWVLGQISRL